MWPQICTIGRSDRPGELQQVPRRIREEPSKSSGTELQTQASAPRLLQRRPCISRKAVFLAAYRETASVRAAAERAGIDQLRHHRWFEADAADREAFTDAQLQIADALRDLAIERAMDGWLEPVNFRGRQRGTIRRYS